VAPGQMGGHKPRAIAGEHHAFLVQRIRESLLCAGWWLNLPSAASRLIIDRCGISFTPRSLASKKTVIASERDRPDIARRRAQWTEHQSRIEPERLVFLDENQNEHGAAQGMGAAGSKAGKP
jgi:hypothetical protein